MSSNVEKKIICNVCRNNIIKPFYAKIEPSIVNEDEMKDDEKVYYKQIIMCKSCSEMECCVICNYWCGQTICKYCRS